MEFKKEWAIPAGIGLGSFLLGGVTGYILARYKIKVEFKPEEDKNQLEFDFERERGKEQFQLQQASYVIKEFNKAISTAVDVVDMFSEKGKEYLDAQKREPESNNEEEVVMSSLKDEPPLVSVFRDGNDDWNYDVELEQRRQNPGEAYTVHRDEYFENEDDYRQTTLTYYAGDNILCDEKDSPIYDPERIVGKLEFGKGSQDPNVVFVRNERLQADYEVLLDHGFYQVEVLGQTREDVFKASDMKHSVRKFRTE